MKEVKFIKSFKDVEGKVHPEGEVKMVTDKHAVWLAANEYIEAGELLKKENKGAKGRKTK